MTHENFSADDSIRGPSNRSFGVTVGIMFAVFSLLPLLHHRPVRLWSLVVSALSLLLALIVPSLLQPLNRSWMRLGALLGKVTNPIVTGLMFYIVFTPTAIVLRWLDKVPLHLHKEIESNTYWVRKKPAGTAVQTMRNQF